VIDLTTTVLTAGTTLIVRKHGARGPYWVEALVKDFDLELQIVACTVRDVKETEKTRLETFRFVDCLYPVRSGMAEFRMPKYGDYVLNDTFSQCFKDEGLVSRLWLTRENQTAAHNCFAITKLNKVTGYVIPSGWQIDDQPLWLDSYPTGVPKRSPAHFWQDTAQVTQLGG
jgi:hypothetical protein